MVCPLVVPRGGWLLSLLGGLLLASSHAWAAPAKPVPATAPADAGPPVPGRGERKPQTRPAGTRVPVDLARVTVDDGDTLFIDWGDKAPEVIRVLGIDCPETQHVEHELPVAQPYGDLARAFAEGVFATATEAQLLRAPMTDPYGRTLGYLFVNGKNYSVLVVQARLAEESVSRYGDNGFPTEAAAVLAAAKAAGPLPFEPPAEFRKRMRDLSRWMKARARPATP
jgi:endonuclease YncB( thermonuclease family)